MDFLLLSCHNPDQSKDDGFDGFGMWRQIPKILAENSAVKFAVLGGDQVYCDEVGARVLAATEPQVRRQLIQSMYDRHWSALPYRQVLAGLPSYLMWDDHDIIDGWGSEESSFESTSSSSFKPEWACLFEAAKKVFWTNQASRNPDTFGLGGNGPFDSCFAVGDVGFVLLDLRSNRNGRIPQIWEKSQFERVKGWIDLNKSSLSTIFIVSPVVFFHGDPRAESFLVKSWLAVLNFFSWLKKTGWCSGLVDKFEKNIGDLRDDLNDSWGSDKNVESAEQLLDYLFAIQNSEDEANVVILSGDIHTSGYSNIYSSQPEHEKNSLIHHIVSSPVAYSAFPWLGEAFFRSRTKTVSLSKSGKYRAQISHHFSDRAVAVLSLRNYGEERQLKVKFYLEGFEEPQVLLFDLNRASHREELSWNTEVSEKRSLQS